MFHVEPLLLDRNLRPIATGSRVTAYGRLGEEDRDVALFSGILVWSPGLRDHEIVIERWHVRQDDPVTRVLVGAVNYQYELQKP